jgi:NAD-dependent aldehyde dehydrogenases
VGNAVVAELMKKAKVAQEALEKCSQSEIDSYVRAIGKVIYDHAEELAREAVDETRMGVYEDKVAKNRGKSKMIWRSLQGVKSIGIIGINEAEALAYVAKPKGVVGAVTPTTNPIVTPMCNAMFALKGGNSIIVSPHPRSKKCSTHAVRLMNEALEKLGAPANLIQIVEEPTMEISQEVMSAADVVVATGGMGLVRAAYSSGKPAYGVGAGNVQVIVDRDYDMDQAAKDIIVGGKFDNGIICSGEQSVIMPKELEEEMLAALKANGAFYVSDEAEVEKFRQVLFINGVFNGDLVGQSVQKVGEVAGVPVAEDAKILLLKAKGKGEADILCKEKLCACLITLTYETFEEALEIAKANLIFEGAGHTAAIHSNNKAHIEAAGEYLPVSRLVVNQASATGAGGSFYNGFAPTTTLGCGSWGNNSISENFSYKHLINISQIGFKKEVKVIPTDEEIWNLK